MLMDVDGSEEPEVTIDNFRVCRQLLDVPATTVQQVFHKDRSPTELATAFATNWILG
jgi:hypothetical protein